MGGPRCARFFTITAAVVAVLCLAGPPASAGEVTPIDVAIVDTTVAEPIETPPAGPTSTDPAEGPTTDPAPTPDPTESAPEASSPGLPAGPTSSPAPSAQLPPATGSNLPPLVPQPSAPATVPVPNQEGVILTPPELLPADVPTEEPAPEIVPSSDAAVPIVSSKPTPSKQARVVEKSEEVRKGALVAFQVNPNLDTATQLAAATGSSPLVQGITLAILLGLGFAYFRFMRPNGKHGRTSTGGPKA